MKKMYFNPYIRLKEYLSLMSDNSMSEILGKNYIGISISELHNVLNIPLIIIRKDLSVMYDGIYILYDEDSDNALELESTLNLSDSNVETISTLLLNGQLDSLPLYYNLTFHYNGMYQLNVSLNELKILTLLNNKNSNIYTQNNLYIKDSVYFNPAHKDLYDTLMLINDAITNNQALTMRYQIQTGQIRNFPFIPIKIIYDAQNNLYSILSVFESNIVIYNLENIKEINLTN